MERNQRILAGKLKLHLNKAINKVIAEGKSNNGCLVVSDDKGKNKRISAK